jgi:chromate transporter
MVNPSQPGLWELFRIWLTLGLQSFGGGSSTFFLVHQACIKRGWLSEEEFVHTWALSQISPGINLVKLTILIGRRLRGWPGLVSAVAGLLLPSAGVTVLMTAGFDLIRDQPLVKAAMRGILPATIGLSLAMAVQMAQPLLTRAYQEGRTRLIAQLLIIAGAAVLMALNLISPVMVLLFTGTAAVLILALIPTRIEQPESGAGG